MQIYYCAVLFLFSLSFSESLSSFFCGFADNLCVHACAYESASG